MNQVGGAKRISPTDALLRDNSIGFLRLLMASMVVFFHAFALSGVPVPGHMYGRVAVAGFFFLSGVLITRSYERCSSLGDYIWRRSLRIFPGLWACLFFSAFVIAPIAFAIQGQGFSFLSGLMYAVRGMAMFGSLPSVGNVFGSNIETVMNGSLWTLPVEYVSYVVIGITGLFGLLRKRLFMAAVALLLYVWLVFPQTRLPLLHPAVPTTISSPMVLEPYLHFALGSAWYLFRDRINLPAWLGPVSVALVIAVLAYESPAPSFQTASAVIRPVSLAIALLWLAEVLPLRAFDREHDLSYGTYIYAFPIQQTLVLAGLAGWGLFGVSYALTLVVAALSWKFVEKPALRHKGRFSKRKPASIRELAPIGEDLPKAEPGGVKL